MDTVSYLTINDETKAIADIVSRNDIENITAIVSEHEDDIESLQLVAGPDGSILTSIDQLETSIQSNQNRITAISDVANIALAGANSASESAGLAWNKAISASDAAAVAWSKAGEAETAANYANTQAISAFHAANTA